jgi:hypothetical protein
LLHEVDVDNSRAFRETLSPKRFVRSADTNNIEQFLMEFSIHPSYTKVSNAGQTPIPTFSPVLRTRLIAVLRARAIPQFVHDVLETLRTRHATYMRESSGLQLESIRMGDTQIARVKHMTYAGRAYAELAQFLLKKHAIVNVHNSDNRCFGHAFLSSLHPV